MAQQQCLDFADVMKSRTDDSGLQRQDIRKDIMYHGHQTPSLGNDLSLYNPYLAEPAFTLADLCRVCATKQDNMIAIFGNEGRAMQLQHKLNSCLPIKVKETDLLPTTVCRHCAPRVLQSHELYNICHNADVVLLRMLQQQNIAYQGCKMEPTESCPEMMDVTPDIIEDTSGEITYPNILPSTSSALDQYSTDMYRLPSIGQDQSTLNKQMIQQQQQQECGKDSSNMLSPCDEDDVISTYDRIDVDDLNTELDIKEYSIGEISSLATNTGKTTTKLRYNFSTGLNRTDENDIKGESVTLYYEEKQNTDNTTKRSKLNFHSLNNENGVDEMEIKEDPVIDLTPDEKQSTDDTSKNSKLNCYSMNGADINKESVINSAAQDYNKKQLAMRTSINDQNTPADNITSKIVNAHKDQPPDCGIRSIGTTLPKTINISTINNQINKNSTGNIVQQVRGESIPILYNGIEIARTTTFKTNCSSQNILRQTLNSSFKNCVKNKLECTELKSKNVTATPQICNNLKLSMLSKSSQNKETTSKIIKDKSTLLRDRLILPKIDRNEKKSPTSVVEDNTSESQCFNVQASNTKYCKTKPSTIAPSSTSVKLDKQITEKLPTDQINSTKSIDLPDTTNLVTYEFDLKTLEYVNPNETRCVTCGKFYLKGLCGQHKHVFYTPIDRVVTNQPTPTPKQPIRKNKLKKLCPICGVLVSSSFKNHLLTHEEKTIRCNICRTYFHTQQHLDKHKRVHETEKNYPCLKCTKKFHAASGVRNHVLKVHSKEWSYHCTKCTDIYETETEIKQHIIKKHNSKKLKVSKCYVKKSPYLCTMCDKYYASKYSFKKHTSIIHSYLRHLEEGKKKYICDFCGSRFQFTSTLKCHLAKHLGVREHICKRCGRSYDTVCAYKRHREKCVLMPMKRTNSKNLKM